MNARPGAAERVSRALFLLGFWPPLLICTWLALTPSPPEAVFRLGDVVLHAFAFTYLTFTLGLAHSGLAAWRVAVWMLAYGALIEVLQGLGPTRSPELKDLLVDAVGISVGLGLLWLLGAWTRRTAGAVLGLVLPR
jgi:VanZ family protein